MDGRIAGAGGSPEVTDGPTTGDGAMDDLTEADVHDLPETASTDRVHRLERDCWCEPEVIEQQAGWAYVVHHTVQEVLAAHADAPMNPQRAECPLCDASVEHVGCPRAVTCSAIFHHTTGMGHCSRCGGSWKARHLEGRTRPARDSRADQSDQEEAAVQLPIGPET